MRHVMVLVPLSLCFSIMLFSTSMRLVVKVDDEWMQILTAPKLEHVSRNETPLVATESDTLTTMPIIDVVSIGSRARAHNFRVQRETWAKHPSIRHFFPITEDQDLFDNCTTTMKRRHIYYQVETCVEKYKGNLLARFRMQSPRFVLRRPDAIGWYCATSRPATGMGVAEQFYRKNTATETATALPDYLLLVDDDTAYAMGAILEELSTLDSSEPNVLAGCLHVDFRMYNARYTPHGGSGAMFSRGALQRLYTPLDCSSTTTSSNFVKRACAQIKEDWVGEEQYFQPNMTLNQLMVQKANHLPSCMFADMLVGYFISEYGVVDREWPLNVSSMPFLNTTPMVPLFGSVSHQSRTRPTWSGVGCTAEVGECGAQKPICHHVTEADMRNRSWDSWENVYSSSPLLSQ